MTVDAVVCARTASTRLPGKTLLRAAGKTMLEHALERLGRSGAIRRVVVATTDLRNDDAIAALCRSLETPVFRGSAEDVVGRVRACAAEFGMEHVAHFGADNPLVDPAVCDQVIGIYLEGGWDYVTNNYPPTWPDGLEVEVTSRETLETLAREATGPRRREHLLTFVWENPDRFRIRNVTREPNLHHERWTLDTPEDWELVRSVFERLYPDNPSFGMNDILALLDADPELRTINAAHRDDYEWLRSER
jgi:spore coat polysaccharide biosynthesis protein SpsF